MDYILCNRKKSKPKVGIDVCKKCKHARSCPDYAFYIQPSLFPDARDILFRRKKRRRTSTPQPAKNETTQVQFNLFFSNQSRDPVT